MSEDIMLNALGEPMPDPNTPTEYTWSVETVDHIDTDNYSKVVRSILVKVVSVGWDGTYGGKLVQDGTYTWKIDFKTTMSDERVDVIGHVNVIK